jgi:hypothetical protein
MESIRLWLNGKRNYQKGVELYLAHGQDPTLKRMFSQEAESDYKRKRLYESLKALITTPPPISKPVASPTKPPPAKGVVLIPGESRWNDFMDEVEASFHAKWKPLYVEMMDLVTRIGDIAQAGAKDKEKELLAGKMALRILNLDDQIEAIYAERDHYLATGGMLEERPYGDPCIDPMLIPLKLANHQRYIRECRAKLQKDPSQTNLATLIKKHEWFVDYYSKQLNKK